MAVYKVSSNALNIFVAKLYSVSLGDSQLIVAIEYFMVARLFFYALKIVHEFFAEGKYFVVKNIKCFSRGKLLHGISYYTIILNSR